MAFAKNGKLQIDQQNARYMTSNIYTYLFNKLDTASIIGYLEHGSGVQLDEDEIATVNALGMFVQDFNQKVKQELGNVERILKQKWKLECEQIDEVL